MTTIATYTELKTAIGSWTANTLLQSGGSEEGQLDVFIDLTEALLRRRPESPGSGKTGGVRINKTRATGTLSTSVATLALPSDYLELDALALTGDVYGELEFVSPGHLRNIAKSGSSVPRFFTIQDVIEFDVVPASAYNYQLSYWATIDALSGSQTTNALLPAYADLYLYGCLHFAYDFLQNEAQSQKYLGWYQDAAWAASETYRRGRESRGAISAKPQAVA